MFKLFSILIQVIGLLLLSYCVYYLTSWFINKEDIYTCDSKRVETVIGDILKKNNPTIFEKYQDTSITVSEVQTIKKDSEINKTECSSTLNISLRDKVFSAKIIFTVQKLKKTDTPLLVSIKNYYAFAYELFNNYESFTKELDKQELQLKELKEANKLGFKNISEYKDYLKFKLDFSNIKDMFEQTKNQYAQLAKKDEQRKNMFKEKNFEYLENDYFEIISVTYNEKAKALEIKVKNKHQHPISDLSLNIYTYDKALEQKRDGYTNIPGFSQTIAPNSILVLKIDNAEFLRYLDKEKFLSYFIDINSIYLKDKFGSYKAKWDQTYGKDFINNISNIKGSVLLKEKEEIENKLIYLKELEKKKIYYVNFFDSKNITKDAK